MKRVKIAAGLAHVDYGHIADIVKEASDAGVDYIHSDAADMHDLKNLQLMGGHQIIEGIRPYTDKPIECHAYFQYVDRLFIEKIARAGCNMLILPAEHHIGAPRIYNEVLLGIRYEDWLDYRLLHRYPLLRNQSIILTGCM